MGSIVIEEVSAEDYPGVAEAVRAVADACDAADGVATLNEQAELQLKHRGLQGARLWLVRSRPADETAGTAATPGTATPGTATAPTVATAPTAGASATVAGLALLRGSALDLAVHPDRRGEGIGLALASAVGSAVAAGFGVDAWSHADHPAAARIARRFGVPRARELLIMARPTVEPLAEVPEPEGVVVRTYGGPADTDAVLAINAAAFAHHPEQGELSIEDFGERAAEAWFDPEGLFLAVPADGGDPLGFHWTKVHRDEDPPYGEVYVVAVHPGAAGRGIGKLLTHRGLAHLAERGLDRVILYVDGDNAPAIAVYRGLGFTTVRTEAQYRGAVRIS